MGFRLIQPLIHACDVKLLLHQMNCYSPLAVYFATFHVVMQFEQSLPVAFGAETAKWICVGAIDITQLSVAGMLLLILSDTIYL